MSTTVTPKPGSQLWGVYHPNREYARELGGKDRWSDRLFRAANK